MKLVRNVWVHLYIRNDNICRGLLTIIMRVGLMHVMLINMRIEIEIEIEK